MQGVNIPKHHLALPILPKLGARLLRKHLNGHPTLIPQEGYNNRGIRTGTPSLTPMSTAWGLPICSASSLKIKRQMVDISVHYCLKRPLGGRRDWRGKEKKGERKEKHPAVVSA